MSVQRRLEEAARTPNDALENLLAAWREKAADALARAIAQAAPEDTSGVARELAAAKLARAQERLAAWKERGRDPRELLCPQGKIGGDEDQLRALQHPIRAARSLRAMRFDQAAKRQRHLEAFVAP
jgi:hypothetical protein